MELSLKKYISSALKLFIPFLVVIVSCIVVCFIDTIDAGTFCAIIIPISSILLFFPAGYYFITFFIFKKKCKEYTPVEGVIFNWKASFYKYLGSVIIKIDDKEYATSAYFTHEECKNLVGKTILYAIIDETLFIYEVKE